MNKEFNEWKDGYDYNHLHSNIFDLFQKLIRSIVSQLTELNDQTSIGLTFDCFCRMSQLIFESGQKSGQQSERDKHRWIPVTERLPTEDDGRVDSDGEKTIEVNVKVIKEDGTFFSSSAFYSFSYKTFYPNDNGEEYSKVIAWQQLPDV